jgi:putative ABC transport system permease protein
MNTLLKDIKYGIRLLAKTPSFTIVAVLSLALGIGANTTIFTLVNTVFFRPLPVNDPGTLMSLFTTDERNGAGVLGPQLPMSRLNFDDYRNRNTVFSEIANMQGVGLSVSGNGEQPEQVFGLMVTGNYFDVLGVKAALGRTFHADEDADPGSHPVAVLSNAYWKTRGSDLEVVGKKITLNGQSFAIIGVMPEGFYGTNIFGGPSLWIPRAMYDQMLTGTARQWFDSRRALTTNGIARLKPGITPAQANAEIQAIGKALAESYPQENKQRGGVAVPFMDALIPVNQRATFSQASWLLMTVTGIVLLIACANLANLLLVRATGRQREVAIRLSLGADRGRLVRQLLTESLLLSIAGGLAAIAIGTWGKELIWSFRPPFLGGPGNTFVPSLDIRVLLFTFALSILTGLLFGIAPAIQIARSQLVSALKEQVAAPTPSSRLFSLRNILVAGQIALSLVALIGAGLFLKSLQNAQRIDPGFDASKLVVMAFDVGAQRMNQARGEDFFKRVLERVKTVPGVESAALASNLPFNGGFLRTVFVDGDEPKGDNGLLTLTNTISTEYLKTEGISIVKGRDFTQADTVGAPLVAIINETMAKRFWPGQDPIGRTFHFISETEPRHVIGVARDSKYITIGENPQSSLYYPLAQNYTPQATLHVRVAGDPQALMGTIRKEVQSLEPTLPLTGVQTVTETISQTLWAPRMGASLLGIFGILALVLAAVGIYGVMSYTVNQRSREIGIRMALGASRNDVMGLVFRRGLILIGTGVTIGLAGSALLSKSVAALLFGVNARDIQTYAAVSVLLAAVAMIASYLPARRGTRVDPVTTLRLE